jgi:hypothetical protein
LGGGWRGIGWIDTLELTPREVSALFERAETMRREDIKLVAKLAKLNIGE